jgi:hypothetical protein
MEWFKIRSATIAILAVFIGCFGTINTKINSIDKDVAIIKTVLVMKNIMLPNELCKNIHETKDAKPNP